MATKTPKKAKSKKAAAAATKTKSTAGLGAQPDGSVVIRIGSDFDLMVARRAIEKQIKNAGAAVGTVSALADGEDEFIDAVQRSLERTLKEINARRSPANQIKGTPIGDEIAAADEKGKTHDDETSWADAIPRPRPAIGDTVELADGKRKITGVLAFVGDGLKGDEDSDELERLRQATDDKILKGAFKVATAESKTFVLVTLQSDASAEPPRVWRVVGVKDDLSKKREAVSTKA